MSKKKIDVRRQTQMPYAFAPVPAEATTEPPVWHDGESCAGRYSGELRCTLRNETPLLVGWERTQVKDLLPSVLPVALQGLDEEKGVLYPLRLPSGERPVVIPGDSLKGMLRHELGALFGAPMERVEERLYSYRPNVMFPEEEHGRFLEPRLAKVLARGEFIFDGEPFPYPRVVEVWDELLTRTEQTYLPRTVKRQREEPRDGDHRYRFGMGAGRLFAEKVYPAPDGGKKDRRPERRTNVRVKPGRRGRIAHDVSAAVLAQYQQTLRHYLDDKAGHFSNRRHPGVQKPREAAEAIATFRAGANDAFQEGDVIWVEWNTQTKEVVSFGWHYYYRWAYRDTVRTRGDFRARGRSSSRDEPRTLRPQLRTAPEETQTDERGRPKGLTAVRRLFGYVSDQEGRAELQLAIGKNHYAQLMGRVSINAALEDLSASRTEAERFLPPALLRELGQPRPSAVEHYLKPPTQAAPRADRAELLTYGDAIGKDGEPLDPSGDLAGRKFYLHRFGVAATDNSEDKNKRSTLALEASRPGATFRFTVRFRDLDAAELAAVMLALCPQQFAGELPGNYLPSASTSTESPPRYLSKLGYARPLGWGSVDIAIAELHFLEDFATQPRLRQEDPLRWFRATSPRHQPLPLKPDLVRRWLELHQCDSVEAGDYPAVIDPESGTRQIYTYHSALRGQHARDRRYRRSR